MVATLDACAHARYPRSVGLLIISMRWSISIWVALSLSGAYPSPISFVGRYFASVGKLGVRPSAFLAAHSSILSIVSRCESVNIPKCVAWYLELNS